MTEYCENKNAGAQEAIPQATILATTALFVSCLCAAPSFAQSTTELRQQIDALSTRLSELESSQTTLQPDVATTTLSQLAPQDFPGSFVIPGTNTAMKIGGYIKVDMGKDLTGNFLGTLANFNAIPVEGSYLNNRGGDFYMTARQSRVNIETRTPSDYGPIKTFIEGDFYGSSASEAISNSYGFRLRQAFGEIGPVLAGQTWTNWYDPFGGAETLDFNGPIGMVQGLRQPQLRYTWYTTRNNGSAFSVAIENPFGDIGGDVNTLVPGDIRDAHIKDSMPDVTARYRHLLGRGHLSVAGVLRNLNVDSGGDDQSTVGYGVSVTGKLTTFGKDNIVFNVAAGDGAGRYIVGSGVGGGTADAAIFLDGSDKLNTVKSWGAGGAYQHWWTDKLRSNFIVSYFSLEDDEDLPLGSTDYMASAYANLIYQLTPKALFGAEYIYGKRQLNGIPAGQNADHGTASRIQASIQIVF